MYRPSFYRLKQNCLQNKNLEFPENILTNCYWNYYDLDFGLYLMVSSFWQPATWPAALHQCTQCHMTCSYSTTYLLRMSSFFCFVTFRAAFDFCVPVLCAVPTHFWRTNRLLTKVPSTCVHFLFHPRENRVRRTYVIESSYVEASGRLSSSKVKLFPLVGTHLCCQYE